MRKVSTMLLLGMCFIGCDSNKGGAPVTTSPVAAPSPQFDKSWSDLASKGAEVLYIEDDRGQGLMGNVRRASTLPANEPAAAPAAAPVAAAADPNAPLPELPAGEDVQKIIKQNLGNVKTCYLKMQREGTSKSGKAIVSFQVDKNGVVQGVKVDAPNFDGTQLPTCMTGQIARWSFPKSSKGGLSVSYPFVFVGG